MTNHDRLAAALAAGEINQREHDYVIAQLNDPTPQPLAGDQPWRKFLASSHESDYRLALRSLIALDGQAGTLEQRELRARRVLAEPGVDTAKLAEPQRRIEAEKAETAARRAYAASPEGRAATAAALRSQLEARKAQADDERLLLAHAGAPDVDQLSDDDVLNLVESTRTRAADRSLANNLDANIAAMEGHA